MTPGELKQLVNNIVTELNAAADFAGTLDPELIPFITIGKAVDKLIPGLVATVDGWIQGNPPTDQEKVDFLSTAKVKCDPDLP